VKQLAKIPPKHKVFLKFVLDPTIEEVSKIGEILYLRPNKVTLLPDGDWGVNGCLCHYYSHWHVSACGRLLTTRKQKIDACQWPLSNIFGGWLDVIRAASFA
jgi:hypothetical protein